MLRVNTRSLAVAHKPLWFGNRWSKGPPNMSKCQLVQWKFKSAIWSSAECFELFFLFFFLIYLFFIFYKSSPINEITRYETDLKHRRIWKIIINVSYSCDLTSLFELCGPLLSRFSSRLCELEAFFPSFEFRPKLSHNLTQDTGVSVSTTFYETKEKVTKAVHTSLKIIVHMFTFRY